MNAKLVIILLASIVIITACAEQFQQQPFRESKRQLTQQQTPSPQAQATPTETTAIEGEKPVVTQQTPTAKQELQTPQQKKTEAECKKQWEVVAEAKNSFISIEKGLVEIFFREGTTLEEAKEILNDYQLQFKEVKVVFPTKEPQAIDKLFSSYRRIIAEVQPGKELDKGCKTLQEESVESVAPVIKIDINALAKK
ncbi:hypothetical protein HYS50_00415 [Candidatus Woesearchaeota archaeon]|nr:hypothetical protein [Candidatus Woesearchaeota archaeon]